MTRKTQGVYDLAGDVLRTLTSPYSEDIIEDVFLAMMANTIWMQRYHDLVDELDRGVVNAWIGRYVKEITGMQRVRQVSARPGGLIQSYTKLTY